MGFPGIFMNCKNLTTVTISEGLTLIHEGMFWGCTALTTVTLPSTIRYIDVGSFRDCSALTTLIIPNTIKEIGFSQYSFLGCGKLSLATQARLRELGFLGNFNL
jgi:hypothetical protein